MTAHSANFHICGEGNEQETEVQNQLVFTKMLQVGWVYENPEGDSESGYRELVIALSKVQNESLFSTELMTIMTELFLQRQADFITYIVFVPWLFYFVLVIFYMSYFAITGSK